MDKSMHQIPMAKKQAAAQNTLALLSGAQGAGKLTLNEVEDIKAGLFGLLGETITRFTGGESSSVMTETAQELLKSIVYCIDYALSHRGDPEESAYALKSAPLNTLYREGLALVKQDIILSQVLLSKVKEGRLPINLLAYNDTIDKALPDFFKVYDEQYHAQDTAASIDYPLCHDREELSGIGYIKNYFETLVIENTFCARYTGEELNLLLDRYGRLYRMEPTGILINLFELVLTQEICAGIVGRAGGGLLLSKEEVRLAGERLMHLAQADTATLTDKIAQAHALTDPDSINYLQEAANGILPRLKDAAEKGVLENCAVLVPEETTPKGVVFDGGEKMGNADFRELITVIQATGDEKEKARLIKEGIHSLPDFLDLFDADCLFCESEYIAVFDALGELELALLASKAYEEELRDREADGGMTLWPLSDPDSAWQMQLKSYLIHIGENRLTAISQLINQHFRP